MNTDNSAVWYPFTQMKTASAPLKIVKAKGSILTDDTGKEYLDINSSWWVNVHGHGREEIKQAIADQFDALDHVLLAGATHPKAEELATRIVNILPGNLTKVFFSDDGSTAVEVALKMVFQSVYNKGGDQKRVLALDGAYHGDTFGAMSIGQRGYFNKPFEHFFFDVDFLDFPFEDREEEVLLAAQHYFETGEFACLIVEPRVQGSAGMRMYSLSFLDRLVALARKNKVLVIFDEIMTGWGRTGSYFVLDDCTNKPDIVCLSKGLTGGVLPMGLTVATDAIFNAFLDDDKSKALLHGHSYTGSALACSAACASLDLFEQKETWEAIHRIVTAHMDFGKSIGNHPKIKDIRQAGTILAIELKDESDAQYFSTIRDKAYAYFLENGILMRPLGNVLFMNPPYCTTNAQLSHCYEHITQFLAQD